MLTDSEREWLKKKERILREGKVWGAWCYACPNFGRDWAECYAHQYCPIFNSHEALQEAALFEARVAAKLADPYYPPMDVGSDGPRLFMPPTDRLKWARIEVEEEMNAD